MIYIRMAHLEQLVYPGVEAGCDSAGQVLALVTHHALHVVPAQATKRTQILVHLEWNGNGRNVVKGVFQMIIDS